MWKATNGDDDEDGEREMEDIWLYFVLDCLLFEIGSGLISIQRNTLCLFRITIVDILTGFVD